MRCIDLMNRRMGLASLASLVLTIAGCSFAAPGRLSGQPSAQPLTVEPPVRLGTPARLRSINEVRVQAAMRIVDANPNGTYEDRPPDVLLAIPVLEIELNANGTVRRVRVSRYPGQAPETTQMAIDAVHRAAPFGDVSHLPKPWAFTEVFLFRDDRRFKPRTLDN